MDAPCVGGEPVIRASNMALYQTFYNVILTFWVKFFWGMAVTEGGAVTRALYTSSKEFCS